MLGKSEYFSRPSASARLENVCTYVATLVLVKSPEIKWHTRGSNHHYLPLSRRQLRDTETVYRYSFKTDGLHVSTRLRDAPVKGANEPASN